MDTVTVDKIVEMMAALTDEERVAVIYQVGENFCLHCGRKLGVMDFCHCENDEKTKRPPVTAGACSERGS